MKIHFKTILMALGLIATLSACHDKDYIAIIGPDGELVPHPGRVIVDPDGIPAGDKADLVDADGNKVADLTPGGFIDVDAGEYKLVVVTPRTGLTVSGTTVSLFAADAATIPEAPEFRAGVSTFTVTEDCTVEPSVNLFPMTRRLIVTLTYTGITPSSLSAIEMDLYHPASAIDVEKGFGAVVASTASAERFTRATVQNPTSTELEFTFNLLGFEPSAAHRIAIRFRAPGGEEVYNSEITSAEAAAFNNGPASIPATLPVNFSREDGVVSGGIEGWGEGWNGGIEGE